jgi:hypothetical protein
MHRSRKNHIFPMLSHDPKTRQGVRDFSNWNRELLTLLRQFTSTLTETARAWDRFKRTEIWYFLDNDSPTASSLKDWIDSIDKTFSDLNDYLWKLQVLEKELFEDSPQGVSHPTRAEFESGLHLPA